jgi:hypothetical protein
MKLHKIEWRGDIGCGWLDVTFVGAGGVRQFQIYSGVTFGSTPSEVANAFRAIATDIDMVSKGLLDLPQ